MSTKCRAAILVEPNQPLIVDDVEFPDPVPDQVLVKLFASGVCHSQLHTMRRPARSADRLPALLGHESTGVVAARGRDVRHVKEGDHVITTWVDRDNSTTNQPLVCGITSPEQGDGKSLVASNLALAFAEAGYRTLLIDADTRRGSLHEVFGAQRRPGLIEVLSGEVPRAEVLHPTSQERLSLLPCGGRRTTNPELIASSALPRLLSDLVREFSVIIVDGPPLSAGIDAFAIGAACENTLMILRHSKTDMRMAKTKLALLRRLPLRTVGVVLNDVTSMGDYKYYGYDAKYRALPEERAVATV